mmetsp:Transcript_2522/g.2563  ORF Transcript_2522/g.2563 Transcript_2522/m.2563 type:complete len:99 (-) Transcript_2522:122-418(-)
MHTRFKLCTSVLSFFRKVGKCSVVGAKHVKIHASGVCLSSVILINHLFCCLMQFCAQVSRSKELPTSYSVEREKSISRSFQRGNHEQFKKDDDFKHIK